MLLFFRLGKDKNPKSFTALLTINNLLNQALNKSAAAVPVIYTISFIINFKKQNR